jgi:hypothetical protein
VSTASHSLRVWLFSRPQKVDGRPVHALVGTSTPPARSVSAIREALEDASYGGIDFSTRTRDDRGLRAHEERRETFGGRDGQRGLTIRAAVFTPAVSSMVSTVVSAFMALAIPQMPSGKVATLGASANCQDVCRQICKPCASNVPPRCKITDFIFHHRPLKNREHKTDSNVLCSRRRIDL